MYPHQFDTSVLSKDGRRAKHRATMAAAAAAAVATFIVFSPYGEAFVDGLVERTPMREHKFAARCLVAGGATYALLVAGREAVQYF